MADNLNQQIDVRELSMDEIDLVAGAADGSVSCTTDLQTGATKCTVTITVHF
jgi:hypothetical protein